MTVSFRGAGTPAEGDSFASAIPSVTASATAGDLSILSAGVKPYSNALTASWMSVAETTSGTTASGVDTGSTRARAWVQESAAASSTVTVTSALARPSVAAVATYSHGASEIWDTITSTTGADGAHGANFAATGAGGLGVAAGDYVVAVAAINTDEGTPSSVAIGGLSGATLGATTVRVSFASSLVDDARLLIVDCPVTAGSSNAAPTLSYTNASSSEGAVVWLRVRAIPAVVTQPVSAARLGLMGTPWNVGAKVVQPAAAGGLGLLGARWIAAAPLASVYAGGLGLCGASWKVTAPAAVRVAAGGLALRGARWSVVPAEPISIPWRELIGTPAYLRALGSSPLSTGVRLEMIDDDDTIVGSFGEDSGLGGVVGGTVTADANATVTRSCSLDLVGHQLVPHAVTDMLHPLSYLRARIWWRIKVDGIWQEVLMFTGFLDEPDISGQGNRVSVRGADALAEVRRAGWTTAMSMGGVTGSAAIEAIMRARAPYLRHSITPVTDILPVSWEAWEPGGDPVDAALQVADACGLSLAVDREGVLVGQPWDVTRPIVWDWSEGEDNLALDVGRSISKKDLANVIVVQSSSPDVDPPVWAIAKDTDETSPTWVGKGREYVEVVDSDTVTTQRQCLALAQQILAERRAWVESVRITSRAIPHLEPRDLAIATHARTGITGQYELTSLQWTLAGEGRSRMDIEAAPRRVVAA